MSVRAAVPGNLKAKPPCHDGQQGSRKTSSARPSSSVIVISANFQVLLLHRAQTSSSFPSAHVFPGGNIDTQDGCIPDRGADRHRDNMTYRLGGLRELFEESGILLAKQRQGNRQLLSLSQAVREDGRKLVHSGKTPFQTWLQELNPNAVLDTDGLVPFSHWITPPEIPKRFTTQMYLYNLPSDDTNPLPSITVCAAPPDPAKGTGESFIPSSDGGVENTAATFLPAQTWLHLARSGSIILYPPQFLLLHLISQFLDDDGVPSQQRVQRLKDFISRQPEDGSPPWTDKCILPRTSALRYPGADGKLVVTLDEAGSEWEGDEQEGYGGGGTGLTGDPDRVILVKWNGDVPREMEVRNKKDVVEGGRAGNNVERDKAVKL